MKRLNRKIVLSAAAFTPGLAFLVMQEIALSFAVMIIGIISFIGICAAALALPAKTNDTLSDMQSATTEHPSLITQTALLALQKQDLDPISLRVHLNELMTRTHGAEGFVTIDDQVAMVLAQVMARWETTDAMQLGDDQARELWLVERLMRATPAEAGEMAGNFITPDAMLEMRDRVAGNALT